MSGTKTGLAAELCYNLDYFVLKKGLVYAHGWVFHPRLTIKTVDLIGRTPAGAESFTLDARYPVDRPDVGQSFGDIPHARQSGFHLLGRVDDRSMEGLGLELSVVFNDRRHCIVAVRSGEITAPAGLEKRRIIKYACTRTWALIRQGRFALLRTKARRLLQTPLVFRRSLAAVDELLKGRRTVLVLDHNLGGGANLYRERYVARKLAEDVTVVLLTFNPVTLAYNVIVRTPEKKLAIALEEMEDLLPGLESCRLLSVVYNNAVLFPDAKKVPGLLLLLKHAAKETRLIINIHDFFTLCPSQHLLNDEGVYCYLPEPGVCARCLARSRQPFLEFYGDLDIAVWRRRWLQALTAADRIRCFSGNSKELLLRVYPDLASSPIEVKPHDMSYCGFAPLDDVPPFPLHIGVVGDISEHKGAGVVNDLAGVISERGLPYRILVVGTISELRYPAVITQTGGFRHQDLPKILRQRGVNMCLFPSICPETFSFVVHELMRLYLPIVAFPFGAQGEAVESYTKGRLLSGVRPEHILDELVSFHRQIYGVKSA